MDEVFRWCDKILKDLDKIITLSAFDSNIFKETRNTQLLQETIEKYNKRLSPSGKSRARNADLKGSALA